MTIHDSLAIFQWWTMIFIIGLVAFPYSGRLFSTFADKGYILSKILGIAVISYLLFVLGELHILPFSSMSAYTLLVSFMFFSFIFFRKKHMDVYVFSKTVLFLSLIEELLFTVSLFTWSYIRATQPTINGLEKYMDFGFVNSILRSTYFPPKDMWYSPDTINYYYFGHLVTATLTKLSQLPSNITFNLMIATLFAFCFSGSFSLGMQLLLKNQVKLQLISKKMWLRVATGGILSGLLVSLGGNLHMLYGFFKPYPNDSPVPLTKLAFSPLSFPNGYWYPNATRFIYHTIHEFPIYSFVVSDLHGHVIDIPFVLFTLSLLFVLLMKKSFVLPQVENISMKTLKTFLMHTTVLFYILLGFSIAIMYMTNALDGVVYLLLTILVVGYKYCEYYKNDIREWSGIIIYTLRDMFIIGVLIVIFSLPFSLFFKSFVSQVGVICAPQFLITISHIGPFIFEPNHCQRSPFWQLATLYGFFYFWVISFIYLCFTKKLKRTKLSYADIFSLLIIICGSILIIIPEFFYLKDIYGDYYRANTMFKLVYQAFIMLSLSSSYIIFRTVGSFSKKEKLLWVPYLLIGFALIVIVLIYPYFAISSYYNNVKEYKGLNGTAYLLTNYPSDAKAIYWLNSHIEGQPVTLEAAGDSYTDYERVSANTGLPTVLGWSVHEWLWHNTYDIVPPRSTDVQTIYETPTNDVARQLIMKYHIQYIFVGTMEYQKYKVSEAKFSILGKVIFHQDTTTIYKLLP